MIKNIGTVSYNRKLAVNILGKLSIIFPGTVSSTSTITKCNSICLVPRSSSSLSAGLLWCIISESTDTPLTPTHDQCDYFYFLQPGITYPVQSQCLKVQWMLWWDLYLIAVSRHINRWLCIHYDYFYPISAWRIYFVSIM